LSVDLSGVPVRKQRKNKLGCGCLIAPLILGLFAVMIWWPYANRELTEPLPIPDTLGKTVSLAADFVPQPVAGTFSGNPNLAAAANGTMHGDGGQSDTHPAAGPFGPDLDLRSRRSGNGMPRQCSTFLHRSDGKLVMMCGGLAGFRMVLLDPDNLQALAYYDLPIRPSSFQALVKRDMGIMMSDSSGGAYMFLDNRDRLVFANSRQVVQRLEARQSGGGWQWAVEREWDLKPYVPHDCMNWDNWFPKGECDMVTTVMPDHAGRYWWTTRYGRVGTLDPDSGQVKVLRLEGEEIQNALAMDDKAVFVLSDHAQYAFVAGPDGSPRQLWRTPYDRGSGRKVGSINQGSGTTPTLLGKDWITFADNADGLINIVVLRRIDGSPVCKVPVFRQGASATDNSMIGWGNSIVLENNAGFTSAHQQKDWNAVTGGIVRLDVRSDESGCDVVWTSPLKVPSVVPKLTAGNGIAWFYALAGTSDEGGKAVPEWALVGLDFRTGREVIRIPTGRGKGWDNNWASLSIGPDGSLYGGTTQGMFQVRKRR
jgi:hypothetical protein